MLGAAPATLDRARRRRAYFSPRGLTVAMRSGLLVYFGDASRPHAKWLALAAVLARRELGGAVYVDVRLPERAAAGFAPGAGPGDGRSAGSGSEVQIGKGESTVAALAAGLAAATPEGRAQSAAEEARKKAPKQRRRRADRPRRPKPGKPKAPTSLERRKGRRADDSLAQLELDGARSDDPQAVVESRAICKDRCETRRLR